MLWPVGVPDRTPASEAVGPGSIPGRATGLCCPAGVPDRTADYGSARRGSIPRRGAEEIVLGVCRISTRPCEGRRPGPIPGEDADNVTLEPDGTATGCNPVQVGSIPTGASWKAMIRPGQRRTLPRPPTRRSVVCVPLMGSDRRSCQPVSSVDRAPDRESGCRGFDSRTNTAG